MFARKKIDLKGVLKTFGLFSAGIFAPLSIATSLDAAEKIYFLYSPLIDSLDVHSLELFAADGTINSDLAFYLNIVGANDEEKRIFRESLTQKTDIDPVLLSRILRTDEGERLLDSFGEIINIHGGSNAKYAFRGAIVNAAFDEQGLTLINVLRHLKVNIQIDINKMAAVAKNIDVILEGTKTFVDEVTRLSLEETESSPQINFAKLPDLRQTGRFTVVEHKWNLTDSERQRDFYALLFQPEQWREGKTPVVVISHGLSSSPDNYAKIARHLASYGYVVVIPQHRGSDDIHVAEFIEGYHQEISELDEFINRPLDISYVLDELEQRNESDFADRLDLKNVGIYGHSYGGYTALAIAGARPVPNFPDLKRDCAAELGNLNNALLLQCRALQLEPNRYNFRDKRVQAVVAANPVNASILGKGGMQKINIPIAINAGSYDPATPFVFEQVRSFPWLTAPDRYLILEEGQAHLDISELDAGTSKLLETIPNLNLPSPELLIDYSAAITLAFFEVYIAKKEDYVPYLSPAYTAYLSEGEEFKTFMITDASTEKLAEAIAKFRDKHQINIDNEIRN